VRQSPASNDVNTEAEKATALEAVTRRQPMKIQQTEKTSVRALVNCRVCELAIALYSLVITMRECSINIPLPIQTPPIVTHTRDNMSNGPTELMNELCPRRRIEQDGLAG
jgi:hypothetical protein